MTDTADQKAAETIARSVEGRIFRLQQEFADLMPAVVQARRAEIQAELAALQPELDRVASRRAPRQTTPLRTP
jgi:hypothetical protein